MFPPKDMRREVEKTGPIGAMHGYVTDIGLFCSDSTFEFFNDNHAKMLLDIAYKVDSVPTIVRYTGFRRAVRPEPHFLIRNELMPLFFAYCQQHNIEVLIHMPTRTVNAPPNMN